MGLIHNFLFRLLHWESWHHHVKYIPLVPVWLWYCIKARSLWFFSASNPSITFGGFEGEGKKEIYEQLPQSSYPKSVYIEPETDFDILKQKIADAGLSYPFAAKPDVGMMGFMFRKISSEKELLLYHTTIGTDYIVQELIEYPLELSLFYYRMPDAPRGTITGFLLKQPPSVTGDGVSSLEELIEKNDDLKYKKDRIKNRFRKNLHEILPENMKMVLSHASNRSQGGKLVNLDHEVDEKLVSFFDKISHHAKHFYYGRYDIKCYSVECLKKGSGYSILEYNGAGAGIQHIYGNGLSLWKAWRIILHHWKMLYRISVYNHHIKGVPYPEWKRGRDFLLEAKRKTSRLKKLDSTFPAF